MLVPVNADRSMAEPITSGSAIAQATPAAIAMSRAGMASAMTRPAVRSWPMTVSRARVIPRSADPSARARITTNSPSAAAVAMVSVMRSPAPCWSGELASEASTPVRNVVTLPGITRSATAVS